MHSYTYRHADMQKNKTLSSSKVPKLRKCQRAPHQINHPDLWDLRSVPYLPDFAWESAGSFLCFKFHVRNVGYVRQNSCWTNQNHCPIRPLLNQNICDQRDHRKKIQNTPIKSNITFFDTSGTFEPTKSLRTQNYPNPNPNFSNLLPQVSFWLLHLHQRGRSHVSMPPLEISHRQALHRFPLHAAAWHAAATAVLGELLRKGGEELFQPGTSLAWCQNDPNFVVRWFWCVFSLGGWWGKDHIYDMTQIYNYWVQLNYNLSKEV